MGIASEMKELTRDITSSRRDRANKLGEIRQETSQTREEARDLIKGFEASRKELKAELKEASVAWQGLTAAKSKTK
jgi:SpoVK/Ycf46/Vps4 family AAA+-type ATPase